MEITNRQDQARLRLGNDLTIRQANEIRQQLLDAFVGRESVVIDIPADADADLSFIQLIESTRLYAAMNGKTFQTNAAAQGAVRTTLERAGFLTEMTTENRAFWAHERA